jgi:tetratricopeptide (TPR) repeat protein
MGKKRKRKKRGIAIDVKAIYQRGMQLYLEEENYITGLKYLFRAAKAGYKKAYGEIGIILYREKNETDKAEEWFKKAEKSDSLFSEAAYEYGMLFYLEKGDIKTSMKYLLQSAKQGCELAYGQIGIILYLEKNKIDEALEWFQKAEAANCIFAPAAYYFGLLLYLEKGEKSQSLEYFQKAAAEGYDLAYGELGSFLYLEKAEIDEAEKWFKKAEEAGCLNAPHAYDYGMLLIEERGDIERGNRYLDKAAEDGY